ncbi:DUF4389 domain-containing protein [Bacterioplanoides sp.]|uniref:DUF4389 domain-containing protein n=1 Tax=Bacterioplanoides sp. TaxID=2066072 RepID=UPI003B5AAF3F
MSDLKDNVTSDAFWLKTIYLVGFFVVYRILDLVILVLGAAQWGFRLLTGDVNPALAQFGDSLGTYIGQIVQYLSGATEEKPYPFQDWPESKV